MHQFLYGAAIYPECECSQETVDELFPQHAEIMSDVSKGTKMLDFHP